MTKKDLFIELANPDGNGVSRWVFVSEFVGKYTDLKFDNGGSWCRAGSTLARRYVIETNKTLTPGNKIDAIRFNGFNKDAVFSKR